MQAPLGGVALPEDDTNLLVSTWVQGCDVLAIPAYTGAPCSLECSSKGSRSMGIAPIDDPALGFANMWVESRERCPSPPRRRGAGYRNVSMQRRSVSRGKVSRGGSPAAGTLFSTTRRGRNISPVCTRVSQVKVREATHTGHTPHNTVLPTAEPSSVRRRRKQAKLARFAKRKPEFLTSPEQLGGDKTAASTVLKTRSAPPPSTRR